MPEGESATDMAPASETKQEKAVASTTPASEPRARRERKQAEFFTPDEPKGDGQKRTIPEVCLPIPFPPRVTHVVMKVLCSLLYDAGSERMC